MAFVDYLAQKGIVETTEGEQLLTEADSSNVDIIDVLVDRGLDRDKLTTLKSEYYNVPARSVESKDIPLNILKFIPEESALHYQFIPIALVDSVLEIGMVDPDNLEAKDALQFISSKLNIPFKLFLISRSDFNDAVKNYKGLTGEVNKALSALQSQLKEETSGVTASKKKETLAIPTFEEVEEEAMKEEVMKEVKKGIAKEKKKIGSKKELGIKIVEDTPVTKIVAVLLRHAIEGGASDIHVEPTKEKVRVRFRVDGVLYTSLYLPRAVHNSVVARIKVLSKLKLDERRKPQDGSFSAQIDDRKIDFRVSTFPTNHGEKVVIRILDPGKGVKSLEETGLSDAGLLQVRDALKKPFGLILLTGPTGSGKSTTLYAMLNELDREGKNVVSLEDPIEYSIDGVSQSAVRPEIGYTFANGLRSILRQDPDIIMVGEIRDKETAQLAIQAALTGHLVFSTLHTNNATGVIPRLIDMGVDPYLIAPTLLLAVAQRLVPVICPGSKKPIAIEGGIAEMIKRQFADIPADIQAKLPKAKEVFEAVPSPECPGGTRGRIGIFEVMPIDKDVEKLILENPVESELLKLARSKGMFTMKEDALLKSFKGIVPFLEVNKFD